MSVSIQLGPPVPFNQIQSTCPPVSNEGYNSCIEIMSKLESPSSRAITDLLGGILGFCKLPELFFETCRMGITEYLDRFQSTDICAPVMRGVDPFKRPFVTFGVQHVVADPKTHTPLEVVGKPGVFTLFQRNTDEPEVWMSAGHPAKDMLPLHTASQQYVDNNGKKWGSIEKLEKLLRNGFLVQSEKWNKESGKEYNIELHLVNTFDQVTPMCPKKDEL